MRIGGLAVILAVVATGCARQEVRSLGPQPSSSPVCEAERTAIEWFPPLSLNELAQADAAVVAQVASVGELRWATSDGRPAFREGCPPLARFVYREVTLQVEEALWSSQRLAVQRGDRLVVTMLGDGTARGANGPIPELRDNQRDGLVPAAGERVLWVLEQGVLVIQPNEPGCALREPPCDGQPRQAIRLHGGWQGNWIVRGDQAVSILPARGAPLSPLVNRLRAERARGPVPNDRRGAYNPLE